MGSEPFRPMIGAVEFTSCRHCSRALCTPRLRHATMSWRSSAPPPGLVSGAPLNVGPPSMRRRPERKRKGAVPGLRDPIPRFPTTQSGLASNRLRMPRVALPALISTPQNRNHRRLLASAHFMPRAMALLAMRTASGCFGLHVSRFGLTVAFAPLFDLLSLLGWSGRRAMWLRPSDVHPRACYAGLKRSNLERHKIRPPPPRSTPRQEAKCCLRQSARGSEATTEQLRSSVV